MSDYLTLSEAARALPGQPTPGTLWRWCTQGIRTRAGVTCLQHTRFGRRLFTSAAWLAEFERACRDAESAPLPVAQTRAGHHTATQALREAGA